MDTLVPHVALLQELQACLARLVGVQLGPAGCTMADDGLTDVTRSGDQNQSAALWQVDQHSK